MADALIGVSAFVVTPEGGSYRVTCPPHEFELRAVGFSRFLRSGVDGGYGEGLLPPGSLDWGWNPVGDGCGGISGNCIFRRYKQIALPAPRERWGARGSGALVIEW